MLQLEVNSTGLHNVSSLLSFPKLKSFSGLRQSIKGTETELKISDFNWDEEHGTITLPDSLIDNPITNFNGKSYLPYLPSRQALINGVRYPMDSSFSEMLVSGIDETVLRTLESISISFYFDMENEVYLRPDGFASYSFEADLYEKEISIKPSTQSFSLFFEDESQNVILASTEVKGTLFESYTVEPPTIEGYLYQGSTHDLNGEFSVNQFDVMTLVYKNIKEFTVTFDSNGGNVVESNEHVIHNSTIDQPQTPTREGYSFEGWMLDSQLWDFDSMVVTEDMTLVAHWEQIIVPVVKHTVTFDSNGGTEVLPISDIISGTTIAAPGEPTRAGYTFIGWEKSGLTWEFDSMVIIGDLTLVAQWRLNDTEILPLIVEFVSNADFNIESLGNLRLGDFIPEPKLPVRQGYTFIGWFNGAVVWNFSTMTIQGDMKLTAFWRKDEIRPSAPHGDAGDDLSHNNTNQASPDLQLNTLPNTGIQSDTMLAFVLLVTGVLLLLISKKRFDKGLLK